MSLAVVNAVRYITSLREGGSLPALIEADDGRTYVVKLRGAAQGPRVLAAEVIVGELARTLGLRVPLISPVMLDEAFGKTEADPDVRELFQRSTGLNAGLEFLPGATTYDPASGDAVSADEASLIVWLDAFTMNVDRSSKNTNLLVDEGALWLIDHGASLTFHFSWPATQGSMQMAAASPFARSRDHVLLGKAADIKAASAHAHHVLDATALQRIVDSVPAEFLPAEAMSVEEQRGAYLAFLQQRLAESAIFEKEIDRARAEAV